MIRIAVIAALVFAGKAQATPPVPPRPPKPPKPMVHVELPRDFDFEMPEIDVEVPEIPPIPDLSVLGELPLMMQDLRLDVPRLIARADHRRHGDRDEDADNDEDEDNDHDDDHGRPSIEERDENGARVYKMNQQPQFKFPKVRIEPGDDWDHEGSTAAASGRGTATLAVKGPVTFQLHAQGGDVEVVTTDAQKVTVTLNGAHDDDVSLFAFGDRIEPAFHGRRQLRNGRLRVELPRGSRLDVSSMSGDVIAQRLGDVRIRTLSGDVKLTGVGKSDVQSISGDVRIEDTSGPVRLHTVSGRAQVITNGASPQVEFQSASGSLDWSGTCARDCHVAAETVSGELRLQVDPKSSFDLSYTSHSGELRDEVNLAVKRAPTRKHGMASGWMEATYGKGEGVIEADAFSGNLIVKKK
ncbi:MAG: DUF4097 family beta strand repeat-containing protein [Myxococcales bacterium]|nr:DUF4097 domain-containing protein [Myxococcales bacterium]